MPSILIHMAIAKRYKELHPDKVLNFKELEKGSIAPDFDENFSKILPKSKKEITHCYISPDNNTVDFNKFKHNQKVDPTNDYWKGYYLHLLTDHLFYTSVFKQEYRQSIKDGIYLYDDCQVLTSQIIKDYHLDLNGDYITNATKQYFIAKDGTNRYLNYEKLRNFIEKLATKAQLDTFSTHYR